MWVIISVSRRAARRRLVSGDFHMNLHIASLEDDSAQAQLIARILENAGYRCTIYTTGRSLLAALPRVAPFDLLLLDWEVPDISGLEVLRWVRSRQGHALPVMFLTSRSSEADLVEGLMAGADDYMIKPIREHELLARVAALLRRSNFGQASERQAFDVGPYHIDPAQGVISLHGQEIDLAPKEYELAQLFFRNPDRLFSRDVLSNSVWNRDIPATSRTIDTHLSNIRRKLSLRPENGVRLSASYALGYRLELVEPS